MQSSSCSLSGSQALFGCLFLSRSLIEHLGVLLPWGHVLPLSFLDEGSFFELLESNQVCTSHCTPLRVLVKFLELNFFICCIMCYLWVLLLHKLCSSSSNNVWFVLLLRLRAPVSPPLPSPFCKEAFAICGFFSSSWQSKSSFVLLVTRKLLQFVVSLLRLREQELLCHLLVC